MTIGYGQQKKTSLAKAGSIPLQEKICLADGSFNIYGYLDFPVAVAAWRFFVCAYLCRPNGPVLWGHQFYVLLAGALQAGLS